MSLEVNTRMIKKMAMEFFNGHLEVSMRAISLMTLDMVSAL